MRIVNGDKPAKQYNEAEMAYPNETGINIITANVVNKSDGQIPFGKFKPYLIKEIHLVMVKLLGLALLGLKLFLPI